MILSRQRTTKALIRLRGRHNIGFLMTRLIFPRHLTANFNKKKKKRRFRTGILSGFCCILFAEQDSGLEFLGEYVVFCWLSEVLSDFQGTEFPFYLWEQGRNLEIQGH